MSCDTDTVGFAVSAEVDTSPSCVILFNFGNMSKNTSVSRISGGHLTKLGYVMGDPKCKFHKITPSYLDRRCPVASTHGRAK